MGRMNVKHGVWMSLGGSWCYSYRLPPLRGFRNQSSVMIADAGAAGNHAKLRRQFVLPYADKL
ncbi:MAG: hypothetical protein ACRESY_00345, partial [Steroidobacteraceae bacterium]